MRLRKGTGTRAMATEGNKLTIKVDPGQFDMLAKATEKMQYAIGENMQKAMKEVTLSAMYAPGMGTVEYKPEEQMNLASEIVNFGPILTEDLLTTEDARELAREVIAKHIPPPRASLVEVDNG